MKLPKVIIDEISSYIGNYEKLRRQLAEQIIHLTGVAQQLVESSSTKRRPKHQAEGILYALESLCLSLNDPLSKWVQMVKY